MTKSLAEVLGSEVALTALDTSTTEPSADTEEAIAPADTEKTIAPADTEVVPFDNNELSPSDWTLSPVEGQEEVYEAMHRVTRKVFVGTIGNFNVTIRDKQ